MDDKEIDEEEKTAKLKEILDEDKVEPEESVDELAEDAEDEPIAV